MTKWRLVSFFLVISIVPLMLGLPIASSQSISTTTSSGVHILAGVMVMKPKIDGVWQKGEWDDANEYRFSTVTYEVNGMSEAYIRCKHDNASLYCLIDVPSDSGATYTRGGQNYTGDAALSFDRDMDGLNRIDPADLAFDITASGNRTLLSFIFNEPAWSSQVNATQQLGVSPHSNNPHKVYEISMPLGPLLQFNKNSQPDNLPAVNLDLTVTDSYGNRMDLSGPPYLSVLEFGAIPVPEGINPLISLASAMLILIAWLYRKEIREKTGRVTH